MPTFSELNIVSIAPMGVLIVGAILMMVLDLLVERLPKAIYITLSIVFLCASLACLLFISSGERGFFDLVHIDSFSVISQVIILVSSIFFMFFATNKNRNIEFEYAEYFVLFLFMIASYQFMVSSSSLIVIFVSLEASSLALYTIIAMPKKSKPLEAAIKYFTLGAVGSGFVAFALAFIYAGCGTLDIAIMRENFAGSLAALNATRSYAQYFLMFGFVFLMGGVGFKLSLFPFHTWVPDVYEGSSYPLAFYMSVATKIAAFVVALRVFGAFLALDVPYVEYVLFVIIILTTTIPNIIALVQSDVTRMLAYSSISQAGFGLACIYINTQSSIETLFLYWILFLWTNLGAFGCLWLTQDKHYHTPYAKFSGLVKTMPLLAIVMGIFMFSLAGIPPFGMFWGKISIILAALSAQHTFLAVILLLNSIIAAFYYIKLFVFMFLYEPSNAVSIKNSSYPMIALNTLALLVVCFAAFLLNIFISMIQYYM